MADRKIFTPRSITFNGTDSLKGMGVKIAPYPDTVIGKPQPKIVNVTVPYMDGSYDFSRIDGELHYGSRILTYTFLLFGENREELEKKRENIIEWLCGEPGDLEDTDFPNEKFVNAAFSECGELEYFSRFGNSAKLKITLTADPKRKSLDEDR